MADALAPLAAAEGGRARATATLKGGGARSDRGAVQKSVAARVCEALGSAASPRDVAAVDQMLVLCADHELNISTFAVRVTASGGADLYACVTAGLCALSGPRHGGICDRLELLAEACRADGGGAPDASSGGARVGRRTAATGKQARRAAAKSVRGGDERKRAERVVRARLAAGEFIPGFGQPLYPDGDPRGVLMLELARTHAKHAPRVQTLLGILDAMRAVGRRDPTLDFGLCALSAALDLPLGAASSIFAVGRVAGWVAHMLEQRERPVLLRPRARYVGV
jgi:citrate synthase